MPVNARHGSVDLDNVGDNLESTKNVKVGGGDSEIDSKSETDERTERMPGLTLPPSSHSVAQLAADNEDENGEEAHRAVATESDWPVIG